MLLTTEKCISYSVGNCKLIVFCWCIYGSLCYIEHRPTAVLYSVLHSTSRGSQQHTVGPLSLASLHVVAKWTFCIFWSSKFMSVLSSLRPAYRSVPIIELFTFRVCADAYVCHVTGFVCSAVIEINCYLLACLFLPVFTVGPTA